MGGNLVRDVATPIIAADAASKGYVDAQVAGSPNALQPQIDALSAQDRDLADGIATAIALDMPQLLSGQTFAMRAGWGNFEGANALGITAAGLVGRGLLGSGSTVLVDAGVASEQKRARRPGAQA